MLLLLNDYYQIEEKIKNAEEFVFLNPSALIIYQIKACTM